MLAVTVKLAAVSWIPKTTAGSTARSSGWRRPSTARAAGLPRCRPRAGSTTRPSTTAGSPPPTRLLAASNRELAFESEACPGLWQFVLDL